jgi:hypothetical protein
LLGYCGDEYEPLTIPRARRPGFRREKCLGGNLLITKVTALIEKFQNFKLLPFFVLISMGIGITLGKIYSISNFELTPPIDAIVSIFNGTYTFSLANSLALGVVIGLFLMMYPAMTNIKFEDLGRAVKSPKALLVVLFSTSPLRLFGCYSWQTFFKNPGAISIQVSYFMD